MRHILSVELCQALEAAITGPARLPPSAQDPTLALGLTEQGPDSAHSHPCLASGPAELGASKLHAMQLRAEFQGFINVYRNMPLNHRKGLKLDFTRALQASSKTAVKVAQGYLITEQRWKLLEDCCDPGQLFAMTKQNSPMGKNLWFDGEFLYSFTIDNTTYSLFPQATPFQLPLKKCSVVGNGGILKKSGCGKQIDQADFVMRCNLPPLSREYSKDVGLKTQLVTANPSIIQKRFQNLLWSRKAFVESVKVYNHSYIYMPAFSMKTGTGPSLRVYYTLKDFGAKQAVLFANPNFLRDIGKFWKSKGIHAKRLSTGLFLVSAALGLCEEVTIYGFWPFSVDLHGKFISHHYYDNVLPDSGFHAMPEEFLQLWFLHKSGVLRMQLEQCEDPLTQSSA
ncbi:alpha-N-acetylneuraminide alpha-2,8-sialyltransferase [Meleagris gallopavo]|uniref:alpha-N-acetylneuraminide alpha-2,8-sialyltransferase n=1 Tax=Meleagris gallopavo TaxID=9103 RepID=UPI0012AB2FBE|nr:alpha-N-acetylneuraminide alpha-2,8-sialyltransferase [Meleagris gallopavo]